MSSRRALTLLLVLSLLAGALPPAASADSPVSAGETGQRCGPAPSSGYASAIQFVVVATFTYDATCPRPAGSYGPAGRPGSKGSRDGNMLTRPGQTLTWDAENRLASVTQGGNTTTFTYNGDSQRVKVAVGNVITAYVGNLYEVNPTSGITTTYYFFGSQRVAMRTASGVTYLAGDHLGSASLATNAAPALAAGRPGGAKISDERYYAYGSTRSGSSPTDYQFTGQKRDTGTGLYYYGARYYDPVAGRFISADTIVPQPGEPQALNRYSYGYGNPVRFTDPTGHFPLDWLLDPLSLAFDVQQLASEPSWENAAWLALDVVLAALPYVPAGAGTAAKAAKATQAVNTAANARQVASQADKAMDAGVAAYRAFRGGGIHAASTGKAFSDWFKASILKNADAASKSILDGSRRLDIVDDAGSIVEDSAKQIYELKNYTPSTSIGQSFWNQASAYMSYAKEQGYTLNYVFGQKIGDKVAQGLIEKGVKVWYIDDAGKMMEWIP